MKNSLVNLTFSGYSFIHSFKELYFRYLFNFLYLFRYFLDIQDLARASFAWVVERKKYDWGYSLL